MNRFHFFLALVRQNLASYLAGVVMLGLTLYMGLSIPQQLQQAIDLLSGQGDPAAGTFLDRITWILVFAVSIMVTRTASRLFFFIPGRRVEFDLKNRLLAHLSTLQRDYFQENPTGSIISRINNDINGIRMTMGFGLMQLVSTVATLSLAPYFMYITSPRLTLYVALPIVVAFGILQLVMRRLRHEQLVQMKAMQDLSEFTVESYNGIDVLKTYRAYGWSERRFSDLSRDVRDVGIRLATIRAFFMPILAHLVNGLKVMLLLIGGLMVIRAEMSLGQFVAFALYLTMLLPPLMGMTFMMFVMQRGLTALTSLESVFNTEPGLPPVNPEAEAALPAVLRHGLRVAGLTYAYPDDPGRSILREVSLEVAPGEIVGLFGPVGAGKSTLVNTINRYLTPPPGTVFLDGIDVTEISQARLRRSVMTVTQDPFLFSDSIRENILFASEDAVPLERAVRAAALDGELERFPDGLDTLVGERGITLSGGQKQRIALARAMMKPCDLLILDDPLSAVDHETERYLISQIYGFQHSRSLLIVSHRVSVLERAHRIVVLDEEGRVTQAGTHAELIEREGIYRTAYLIQSDRAAAEGAETAHGPQPPPPA